MLVLAGHVLVNEENLHRACLFHEHKANTEINCGIPFERLNRGNQGGSSNRMRHDRPVIDGTRVITRLRRVPGSGKATLRLRVSGLGLIR
jgi:hypothetical protein